MAKKGLGRGLQALIRPPSADSAGESGAGDSVDPETGEQIRRVPLDQIVPSPFQPRKRFNEEQLGELVDSIREHDIIQPLVAREAGGKLELIAGERRLRACQKLGLDDVPVIVRKASDEKALEMALIENLQREDLDAIEEAEAYARLARDFNLTQDQIARRVGKNRATVANAIRLLDLDPALQELVSQKHLSAGHAKAILGLKGKKEQALVADKVIRKKLTVREAERLVSDLINGVRTKRKTGESSKLPKEVQTYVRNIEDRLRSRFATNITVNHGEKKGKIEIEYFGNDDLGRILDLLGIPEE